MNITIKIKNFDEVKEWLDKRPEVFRKEINRAVKKSVILIQGEARRNAPVDTGLLRSRIETRRFESKLEGQVFNRLSYALSVHEGTRPHFPPIDALRGWSRRHGIEPFLVARAISRRGTRATKFLSKAVRKNKNKIDRFFQQAVENLIKI